MKFPLRQFAVVIGVRIAVETQGAAVLGFSQYAAPVGFQDRGPKVFAAAEIGEIGARAIDQQTAVLVGQPHLCSGWPPCTSPYKWDWLASVIRTAWA